MNKENFYILLNNAVKGNQSAFEKLIRLYEPLIKKKCYINGAYDEDLEQEILIQIARKITSFSIQKRA